MPRRSCAHAAMPFQVRFIASRSAPLRRALDYLRTRRVAAHSRTLFFSPRSLLFLLTCCWVLFFSLRTPRACCVMLDWTSRMLPNVFRHRCHGRFYLHAPICVRMDTSLCHAPHTGFAHAAKYLSPPLTSAACYSTRTTRSLPSRFTASLHVLHLPHLRAPRFRAPRAGLQPCSLHNRIPPHMPLRSVALFVRCARTTSVGIVAFLPPPAAHAPSIYTAYAPARAFFSHAARHSYRVALIRDAYLPRTATRTPLSPRTTLHCGSTPVLHITPHFITSSRGSACPHFPFHRMPGSRGCTSHTLCLTASCGLHGASRCRAPLPHSHTLHSVPDYTTTAPPDLRMPPLLPYYTYSNTSTAHACIPPLRLHRTPFSHRSTVQTHLHAIHCLSTHTPRYTCYYAPVRPLASPSPILAVGFTPVTDHLPLPEISPMDTQSGCHCIRT